MYHSFNDPWKITLFGGLRAQRGDQVITRFKTQKIASLFAYLAFYTQRTHSREILIELLWPESDVATLRNSLSVALSSLRNQFEPPGVPQGAVIRADRFSVGLNPVTVSTDVAQFEQALKAAAQAANHTERHQLLSGALDLYRGALLPGFYEDWIVAEQQRLAGLFFDAMGMLVTDLETTGDIHTALSYARQAVAADPLREDGQGHFIRLLAANGQPGAAMGQYKEYERLREEQAGDEPSAALRGLFRRIEKESGFAPPALPTTPRRPVAISSLPTGPVTTTILMSDIVGSTHIIQQVPDVYPHALERHHFLLQTTFSQYSGQECKEMSNGFVVAFGSAGSALAAAIAAQKAIAEEPWPEAIGDLQVRMALHTGDVRQDDAGNYEGEVLHYTSRMLTAAHGGQVLVSEATAGLLSSDVLASNGAQLSDLGVYRLRDIPEAKRIFQVLWPDMGQSDFGPLAAESGHRSNLPARFTRFFGRAAEQEQLAAILAAPETRLVTITGPGGNGKTRLALEVAERQAGIFAGAVYFVPLTDLSDPSLIAGAILNALRVPHSPQQQLLIQAAEVLAQKPTLLVLDNFEQFLGVGAQDIEGAVGVVQTLLADVPSLKILITSRQLLGLSVEREFALSPMPVPDGNESAEQLSVFDSVQLFIDRAQQVKPDFQVSNTNAAAVAAIAVNLEGIPLAIELAAARAQVLPPSQILTQLSRRFDFLTTRRRDTNDRHRTLHDAMDWSYQLLTPELQRFFCRLSVFRGGGTIEAAEAVCEEPLSLDYWEQLRECSLVFSREQDNRSGEIRFVMLETLREFAEALLSPSEKNALSARHLKWCFDLASAAPTDLGSLDPTAALARLDAELDNIRAALAWCRDETTADFETIETGLQLAANLDRFWLMRGYLNEGRDFYANLLARWGDTPTVAQAEALSAAAVIAREQGNYTGSRTLAEQSLAVWRKIGDPQGIARGLNNAAIAAKDTDDISAARSLYGESLALYDELGDETWAALVLNNLSNLAREQGDYVAARAAAEQGLARQHKLGDRVRIANSLGTLAVVSKEEGDLPTAQELFEQALALLKELEDRRGIAISLSNLADLARTRGEYETSQGLYDDSLALWRDLGYKERIAATLSDLAGIATERGDYTTAQSLYVEGLSLWQEMASLPGLTSTLHGFARLALAQGQAARAVTILGAMQALGETMQPTSSRHRPVSNDHTLETARGALDEKSYNAAWAVGRRLSLEQAFAYVINNPLSSTDTSSV